MSDKSKQPSPSPLPSSQTRNLAWPRSAALRHKHELTVEHALEVEQTHHLGKAIAARSADELEAIAETSPKLIAEWMLAFQSREAEALREAAAARTMLNRLSGIGARGWTGEANLRALHREARSGDPDRANGPQSVAPARRVAN